MPHLMGDFQISDRLMRYSDFIPRFYNLCRSYGFTAGKIMPSRAFCSDESQGFPIILITKHFGTFSSNHGRVGGIVATGRHGLHAHHVGRDAGEALFSETQGAACIDNHAITGDRGGIR